MQIRYPHKTTRSKRVKSKFRSARILIDLGNSRHRSILFLSLLGLLIFVSGLLLSGYVIYEYTESSEFCGTLCHTMNSQYTRYQSSAHVNVACADCHIGPGATHFIKSKIEGVHELIAQVTGTYERPIKSPVKNLRPARETCETCHTPTSFRDNVVKTHAHYENDIANTPVITTLILKMGGWKESTGISQGIHWHITRPVYYIAADEKRQEMIWVGVEQVDGSLKEFYSRDILTEASTGLIDETRMQGEIRRLDCIDCHNRAAHFIPSPEQVVDEAISDDLIARNIPFIRAKAVELLKAPYDTEKHAQVAIGHLQDFYRNNYPDSYTNHNEELDQAITQIKLIYTSTNFPEMSLNWESNPDNKSHSPFLGCFRCHDDNHVSVDDLGNELETISVECNLCHTVPIVGRGDELLVEAPVIVGDVPESHAEFKWTIDHRSISDQQKQDCFACHGQGFCNNGVCHNLEHPEDMLFKHAQIFRDIADEQTCYTCHQDITCANCHPNGIVANP